MKVRVSAETTEEQARVIAEAFAAQYYDDVTVLTDGGEELADADYHGPGHVPGPEPESGPTEREQLLWEEIAEIHEGGPEKYKEQLPEQGKHFVRDRIDLWFNSEQSSAGSRTASGCLTNSAQN